MERIKQISVAGVANSMIINTKAGIIEGKKGSLYIQKDLLKQIRFVDEGRFVQNEGEPVLSIVGKVEAVCNGPVALDTKSKEVAITETRILEIVMHEQQVDSPDEYLKKIVSLSAKNYPIYYFLKLLEVTEGNEKSVFDNIVGQKSIQAEIEKRIENKGHYYYNELKNTGTSAYLAKKAWRDYMLERTRKMDNECDEKYCFDSIRSLDAEQVIKNKKKIQEKLVLIFENEYQNRDTNFRSGFRKALCYLDEILYGD